MRLSRLFFVSMTALLLAGVAAADESAEPTTVSPSDASSSDGAQDFAWDQFDDPEFDPTAATEPTTEESDSSVETTSDVADVSGDVQGVELSAATPPAVSPAGVVLGPTGVDDEGRSGRLHTVARGDTLWDLSAAYLGTPWVWPSVWTDNNEIANPHVIAPGDKIWITANEMRVVTAEEAESFLLPVVEDEVVASAMPIQVEPAPALDEEPVAVETFLQSLAALEGETDDAFPVAIPAQETVRLSAGRQITIARRDSFGFVTADDLSGATSIVASESERTFLSAGDPVNVGLGEGDVKVGDQFTIFNLVEEVRDVETNRLLGHHVENLGWIEVTKLTGDSSVGEIRQSYSEIPRRSSLVARKKLSRRVTVRTTPDAIEGQVVFMPSGRSLMADGGYVYLNRGEFHGMEVGSELEVFQSGAIWNEHERRVDVRTPDRPIATLIVVTVEPESSVAFVLDSNREIAVGDSVRPAVSRSLAQR